jgi:hypothetical protein
LSGVRILHFEEPYLDVRTARNGKLLGERQLISQDRSLSRQGIGRDETEQIRSSESKKEADDPKDDHQFDERKTSSGGV